MIDPTSKDIVHFSYTFFPDNLGSVVRIYNSLLNDGNRHLIFHHRGNKHYQRSGRDASLLRKDNFVSIPLSASDQYSWKKLFPRLGYPYYVQGIRKWLHVYKIKPVLVHGHFHSFGYAQVACSLAKSMQVPLCMEVHAPFFGEVPNSIMKNIRYKLEFKAIKKTLRACDQIVTQSEEIKTWLKDLFEISQDITVIPNGVDTSYFCCEKHKDIALKTRKRLKLSDKFVIFYAGHLDETNGIGFLIDIILSFQDKMPDNVVWLFAGDGPLKERIEAHAKDKQLNIVCLGLLPQEDMPLYYALSDLFTIPRPSTPATEFTVPLKLIEIMSMKKPVLVSSVRAMKNMIIDGENGFLFNPGDESDFLRCVTDIVKGKYNLINIGNAAQSTALEKYSWEKSREKYRMVYDSIFRA